MTKLSMVVEKRVSKDQPRRHPTEAWPQRLQMFWDPYVRPDRQKKIRSHGNVDGKEWKRSAGLIKLLM